ncbi:MAG: trypsin-like peptidase domain-containing protein [Alistipes sp.]|nr:trypsin-like peptidase domain-containing protein [Alistipes sp.]
MKRFLFLLCILCTLSSSAQITVTSKYKPTDWSKFFDSNNNSSRSAYDEFEDEIEQVSSYISSLLGQNIDNKMREFLNSKYTQTRNIHKKLSCSGLSYSLRSELKEIKNSVQQEIVNYNNRVAAHNAEVERKRQEEERLAREESERIAKEEAERNANWSGTGFALRNKYVVTNYHVIGEARTIKILGVNNDFNKEFTARVCVVDKHNDLALLEIVDESFTGFGVVPYYTKTQMAEVGESVFVLGYPLTSTMGDEIKLTTGVISSRTGFRGDVSSYQFSAPVQPGNSGAPLFDNKGNLVGIVSAKHTEAENAGYAVKTSYLKQLTDCIATTGILPYNNHTGNLPLTDKVKKIKNYVFIIKCSKNSTTDNISTNTTINKTSHTNSQETLNPYVQVQHNKNCTIKRVELADTFTAIEISCRNFTYCSIDRETYITTSGEHYKLTKAEGIKYYPEKTYIPSGQSLTFTLYFPPISNLTTNISLIEPGDSDWKFYGINLK